MENVSKSKHVINCYGLSHGCVRNLGTPLVLSSVIFKQTCYRQHDFRFWCKDLNISTQAELCMQRKGLLWRISAGQLLIVLEIKLWCIAMHLWNRYEPRPYSTLLKTIKGSQVKSIFLYNSQRGSSEFWTLDPFPSEPVCYLCIVSLENTFSQSFYLQRSLVLG